MRQITLGLLFLVLGPTVVLAEGGWADSLFKDGTTHDFGSVPHGAQLYHRFTVYNRYAVPMTITSVQASCGCVTVTPSFKTLGPRETGYVDINMDARRFTGSKNVRVNITVGPEYSSTAELKINAFSRADVVFNPSQVTFGVVSLGDSVTQTIDVEYAGKLDWRVKDVVTNGAPVTFQLQEMYRESDRLRGINKVGYKVQFILQANANAGAIKQEVFLQTNDPASPMVPILIEANVQASLAVSPDTLKLLDLKVAQEKIARVQVRGSRAFRILGLEGADDTISLATPVPTSPAAQHTVMLRIVMTKPGDLRRQVQIRTDLQETPLTVTIEANANP